MQAIQYEKGNWKVMRNCCTQGQCLECTGRPVRVVQGEGYSQNYARYVAQNWKTYQAVALEAA